MAAKINIENNVGSEVEGPEEPASAYKVSITSLDDPTPPTSLVFPYNPAEDQESIQPQWPRRNAAGSRKDQSYWDKNDPAVIRVEHLLDNEHWPDGLALPWKLHEWLEQLKRYALKPTVATQQPTKVLLQVGPQAWIGHIENLVIRAMSRTPAGYIDVAQVTFDVVENEET